ncbi:MAG: HAMP domain-containing histidine kinase [Deltaproteobacteria bacterium]|jgi:two-component system sensor histidine kinase CpxA|nr:HAMP domain-containing histidine kinase [Deltaproteobacteria bacterium]
MLTKLWRKIFFYSFLIVLLAQVGGFTWFAFAYNQDKHIAHLTSYFVKVAAKAKDLNDEDLEKFINFHQIDNFWLWLEDETGRVLRGRAWPGMEAEVRAKNVAKTYEVDGAYAYLLKIPEKSLIARVPLNNSAGPPLFLCFNRERIYLVHYWGVFAQGILGVVALSFFLSLWTSKRISHPLAKLRDGVTQIAAGDLNLRLPESGEDEVAEVSVAVNVLTENLSKHVVGVKQLMANMSHETRSSVASLSMALEILDGALKASPPNFDQPLAKTVADCLSQARLEVNLLENMVASGLLSGKLELRHQEVELAPLDFSSLCRQVVKRNAYRAGLKKIDFSSQIDSGLWLLGDEALLDRLLANVLDNALKYTEPKEKVVFSLAQEKSDVLVACYNDHQPLSEESLENLGLPYYRAGESRVYGSGLGLYLVKKIVSLHKGEIEVENHEKGVLLSVRLPLPA